MSPMTIIDNEYASLWFHPTNKIVHHQFHQFVHGAHFRQILERGAEVFEQNGSQKWLSDDRDNSALLQEDSQWAIDVWQPRVMNAGWKYWALVMPKKVVGKMNMKQFVEMYRDQGITVEVFEEADQALQWLERQ